MSDQIDVSINQGSQLPAKQIEDSVTETPEQLLERTASWATNGTALNVSSHDGLRHLLAESRDRSSMFMSILALQRMKRVSDLVNITEDIQKTLFTPERISMMDTQELLQALRYVENIVKENIEFVNKSTEDSTTGAQILINMVDARSLTLSREDVPEAQSRESIRHAVMGLIEEFTNPSKLNDENTIDV